MSTARGRGRIRPARAADLPQLAALCQAHARYERTPLAAPPAPAALQAALAGPAPALAAWCLVDDEDQLHGYASGSQAFCTWTASPVFILDCLYLEPAYRGRGDGRRLLEAAAAHARTRACLRIEWVTPTWNEGAIGFYRAIGARDEARARFRLALPAAAGARLQPRPPCR